jgi:hypothetical protein
MLNVVVDEVLAAVVDAWPTLPEEARHLIMAIIDRASDRPT